MRSLIPGGELGGAAALFGQGNGIKSAPAQLMTAQKTADREPTAAQSAVKRQCLQGVGGTARIKATGGRQQRADKAPISGHREDQESRHQNDASMPLARVDSPPSHARETASPAPQRDALRRKKAAPRANSLKSASRVASAAPRRAMITRSKDGGRRSRSLRKMSRRRRLIRARQTALPTLRLTVSPSRRHPSALGSANRTRAAPAWRRPRS